MIDNARILYETVIENDYCIGCGICASVDGSPFEIKMNNNGQYQAFLKKKNDDYNKELDYTAVCPFADHDYNETTLGKELFSSEITNFDKFTGYSLKHYAGYVVEGEYRELGSSGGMGNWIASQLLKKDLVDGVIHVKELGGRDQELFEYQISTNIEELYQGAKSKYYPIELSEVLKVVRNNKGKFALIGIPCFIKSVRLLAKKDPVIEERIKYFIGLVCGHLKSDMFAKSIGWELGIEPKNLQEIDFRKKLPDRGANDYGVEVVSKSNESISSPTKSLYTTNWGQGFFKYNACEFCDDVLAETADITVGDAWLPEYTDDYLGTNVVTVRNPNILEIVEEGIEKGNLYLDEITAEKVYQSQAGGFRHRRDGLAYRLHLKEKKNEWYPKKRVQPSDRINDNRKKVYMKRGILSKESFNAYSRAEEENNFEELKNYMDPLIEDYNRATRPSFLRRLLGYVKRKLS